MSYWSGLAASPSHLRLLEGETGWRKNDDAKDPDGKVIDFGAGRSIESVLNSALNASNLVLLTGAGSSFCARNTNGLAAPTMADLWDAVSEAASVETLQSITALIPSAANLGRNIEKLLTLCKLYVALFDNAQSASVREFITTAEKAILGRVNFIDDTTDLTHHRTLIRKIARRGLRKSRARIFTTNYDLSFEYAARGQQFVVIDGFSHSTPQMYDRAHFSYDIVRRSDDADAPNYIENVFHLYKLHGSLDWRRKSESIYRSRNTDDGEPALIYPRDSKYEQAFEPPYLDMMSAFQAAIREPDTCLIVSGFGFNDDHISKPIMAAIEANISLRLILCDIVFLNDESLEADLQVMPADTQMRVAGNLYLQKLKQLALLGDKRISLINGRFEDVSLALPDLVSKTEREQHLERMLSLRSFQPQDTAP